MANEVRCGLIQTKNDIATKNGDVTPALLEKIKSYLGEASPTSSAA